MSNKLKKLFLFFILATATTLANAQIDPYGSSFSGSSSGGGGGGGVSSNPLAVYQDGILKSSPTLQETFNGTQFIINAPNTSTATIALNPATVTLLGANPPAASIAAGNLGSGVVNTNAAGGDLTGNYPNPSLIAFGTQGTFGSAAIVPQIITDTKGRIISVSSVTIIIPAGNITAGNLASGVVNTNAAGGDLTGNYPNPTLITVGTPGTFGSASIVPQIVTDSNGRVLSVSSVTIAINASNVAPGTFQNSTYTFQNGVLFAGNSVINYAGQIGVGGVNPINSVDIFTGGETIGADYAGKYTAPTNGLLMEGYLTIGSSNSIAAVSVSETNGVTVYNSGIGANSDFGGVFAAFWYGGNTGFFSDRTNIVATGRYHPGDFLISRSTAQFFTPSQAAFTDLVYIAQSGNVFIGTSTLTVPQTAMLNVFNQGLMDMTCSGTVIKNSLQIGAAYTGFNCASSGIGFNIIADSTTVAKVTNLGIGIGATPLNGLDVSTSVAVGSYAGVNSAPAGGIIMSGNLGVGTASPATTADINGNLQVGSGAIKSTFTSSGNLIVPFNIQAATFTVTTGSASINGISLKFPAVQCANGQTWENDGNGNLTCTSPGGFSGINSGTPSGTPGPTSNRSTVTYNSQFFVVTDSPSANSAFISLTTSSIVGSSQTVINTFTTTNATLGSCIPGSTITYTSAGNPMGVDFSGTATTAVGIGANVATSFLIDGAYPANTSSTVGLGNTVDLIGTGAATSQQTWHYMFSTNPSAGTHSFCFTSSESGGASGINNSSTQANFIVVEYVGISANANSVSLGGNNRWTGPQSFSSATADNLSVGTFSSTGTATISSTVTISNSINVTTNSAGALAGLVFGTPNDGGPGGNLPGSLGLVESAHWALDTSPVADSSGCLVMMSVSTASPASLGTLLFTSTTTASLNMESNGVQPGILMEPCTPGKYCRVATCGFFWLPQGLTVAWTQGTTADELSTSATRCKPSLIAGVLATGYGHVVHNPGVGQTIGINTPLWVHLCGNGM